jgi:putative PIN family toxin of toxin-antitoxin system
MTITVGAVFDTNVVYAALRSSQGASRLLLDQVFDGQLTMHLTVPLLLEYNEVLLRERRAVGVTQSDVVVLLGALAELGQWHEVHYLWRPVVEDPDDAHVLEAATAAGCPNLVTFNTKDFAEAHTLGVDVLRPSDFLERIY